MARADAVAAADLPSADEQAAPALQRLTLRLAEALFAQRSHELRLAQRAVEGAEADVVTAAARPNPTLSISSSSIGTNPGIGSGSIVNKQVDTVVGVSQLIERGNKRELRTGAAEHTANAARNDRSDTNRLQLALLRGAYYDLAAAQQKLAITDTTARLFDKTLDAAGLRLRAGDISPTEHARISVDALRARNDVLAARAEQERAQLALAYFIGAERDAKLIRVIDPWPRPRALESVDTDAVIAKRADIQAAQARLAAAEKARDLAMALRTRDVTIGLQYEHYPGSLPENSVGVAVSVPLFTQYYYAGEIRRAEVDRFAAQDNIERVQAVARAEIGRAYSDTAAAAARLERLQGTLLPAAQRAADGAEFAYTHGAIGVMDLLDARRQLYAVQLEAVGVRADYAKALAAWQAATAPAPSTAQ